MENLYIDLNLTPSGVSPRLHLSQYDKGRKVECTMYADSTALMIPEDALVTVEGTKADNKGFQYECEFEGDKVIFTITEQMSMFEGEVEAEIVIYDGENRYGTANFIIDVEAAGLKADVDISKTELPILEQLPAIRNEVKEAADEAIKARDEVVEIKDSAIKIIGEEKDKALEEIASDLSSAKEEIESKKGESISEIESAELETLEAISSDKTGALVEINTAKDNSITAINKTKDEAIKSLDGFVEEAESFAHGGTGTRQDEDTDNASYYAQKSKEYMEQARRIVNIDFASDTHPGLSKGDGDTIHADEKNGGKLSLTEKYAEHPDKDISSEEGVHGLRYNESTKTLQRKNGEKWEDAGAKIDIDNEMSDESENPVQNKVIKSFVDDHKKSTFYDNKVHGLSYDSEKETLLLTSPDGEEIEIGGGGGMTAEIIVTAPENSTTTISKGATVYTHTESNFSQKIKDFGLWTVSSTNGEQTTETTVEIAEVKQYEITLKYFGGRIDVTYPEGAVCTCEKGIEVLTAPDTTGHHVFILNSGGEWTIKITQGEKSATQTVNVEEEITYPVNISFFSATIDITYPEGATCTVNDESAPDKRGAWKYIATSTGNYVVRATQGSDKAEQTVQITTDKETKTVELSFLKIVGWATGTDEEIVAMVQAADEGKINLQDYWTVGQERNVTLSSMSAVTGIDETHQSQTVSFVLMDKDKYELVTPVSGKNKCSFVVGQKHCLNASGKMNITQTNVGGWQDAPRRNWCNSVYYNAIPSTLRGIFKKYKRVTSKGGTTSSKKSTGLNTVEDYFGFVAEMEVFGTGTYSATDEQDSYGASSQLEWYKTSSNRIKNVNGSANGWWESSSSTGNSSAYNFCIVNSSGAANNSGANSTRGLAPVGCI